MKELSPKEISKLIKEAGFRSKAEFARHFGLNVSNISVWGVKREAPSWFLPVITLFKRIKKLERELSSKEV